MLRLMVCLILSIVGTVNAKEVAGDFVVRWVGQPVDGDNEGIYYMNAATERNELYGIRSVYTYDSRSNSSVTKSTDYIKVSGSGIKTHIADYVEYTTQPCLVLQPDPNDYYFNCWVFVESYEFAVSPNGEYFYRGYRKIEQAYGASSGNRSYQIRSSIQFGPNDQDILVNLGALGYQTSQKIEAVNNEGTVLLRLQTDELNANGYQNDYLMVSKTGETRLVSRVNGYFFEVKLNDLGTVFFSDGGTMSSIDIDGIWKTQATRENDYYYQHRNHMFPTNIQTQNHPEGVLYYLKTPKQIWNTEGEKIADSSGYGTIFAFSVNDDKKFVFTAQGGLYDREYSAVFIGPDLEKDRLVESGDTFGGELVRFPLAREISKKSEFFISYSGSDILYPSETYNNNVFFLASAKPKDCNVETITGRAIRFESQLSYVDNLGFPLNNSTQQQQNTIAKRGCVLTALSMLFDFYGFKKLNYNNQWGVVSEENITPKNLNEVFKSARDNLQYRSLEVFSKDPSNKRNNNNIDYFLAAHAARTLYGNKCFQNTFPPDFEEMEICAHEASSKISYKPSLSMRWQNNGTGDSRTAAKKAAGLKFIEKEICAGNPVLLRVAQSDAAGFGQHTVLATETRHDPDTGKLEFYVKNPGSLLNGDGVSLSSLANRYPNFVGFNLYRQADDPSMITIAGNSTEFVVFDSQGRRAGFDPVNNIEYSEIPGALYSNENVAELDSSGEPIVQDVGLSIQRSLTIETASVGAFKIKLYPRENAQSGIRITQTDLRGYQNGSEYYSVPVQNGVNSEVNFRHTDKAAPSLTSFLQITTAYYSNPNYQLIPDKPKKGSSSYTQSIYLVGKLILPNGSSITKSGNFTFSVGSISDYNLVVPLSLFNESLFSGVKYFDYAQGGITIRINENGEFSIQVKDYGLNSVSLDKWGNIELGINGNTGSKKLNIVCAGDICGFSQAD